MRYEGKKRLLRNTGVREKVGKGVDQNGSKTEGLAGKRPVDRAKKKLEKKMDSRRRTLKEGGAEAKCKTGGSIWLENQSTQSRRKERSKERTLMSEVNLNYILYKVGPKKEGLTKENPQKYGRPAGEKKEIKES